MSSKIQIKVPLIMLRRNIMIPSKKTNSNNDFYKKIPSLPSNEARGDKRTIKDSDCYLGSVPDEILIKNHGQII